MKKVIKFLFIFISLFIISFLISCNDEKEDEVKIKDVNITLNKLEFTKEELQEAIGKISYINEKGETIEVEIIGDMFSIEKSDDKYIIKVSYVIQNQTFTKEFTVTIEKPEPEPITLVKIEKVILDKDTFEANESVQLSGKVVLKYSDGSTMEVSLTNDLITMPDTIATGENKATVSYEGKAIYVSFYVKADTSDLSDDELLAEEIKEYLKEMLDGKEFSNRVDLIYEYKNISIDYESNNTSVISHTGLIKTPILDTKVDFIYYFFVGNLDIMGTVRVTAKGSGTYADATLAEVKSMVPSKVTESFSLPVTYDRYEATLVWSIAGVECPNGYVEVKKEEEDYYITVSVVITAKGSTAIEEFTIYCSMLTDIQRMNKALNRVESNFKNVKIDSDVEFPANDEDYGCKLIWYSYNPDIITHEGKYIEPFYDININIKVQAKIGLQIETKVITVSVVGKHFSEKWEKIEYFINRIHKDEIKTQRFNLYGCEEGYYTVPTKNIGYLPFYTSDEIKIVTDYLPNGTNLKPDRLRTSTYYITLHNTGMAHPTATAKGLNDYIHSTDRQASWHYAIDDHEAYNHVPVDEVTWHAGDGSRGVGEIWYSESYRFYGIGGGNNNSVSIEMCVYSGCDFNWVMRNTAKHVSWLLVKYHLNPSRIRQHYDYSGKDCPQVLRQSGRWPEMLELINIEYFARTELSDVTFVWKSLNPEIMDDTGTVINNPGVDTEISYQVEVTYNNETKVYIFKSLLKKI